MASGAAHRTERLMCLVFILKARGRRGITRAQLRSAVQDYTDCPNDAAFERMFERDKRDLREAGVIVDVIQRDAWHEDEHAYVLASSALLTLPQFSTEEFRVLGQAADAWDRGSWEALATGAIRKVEVFVDDFDVSNAPRISIQPDAYVDPIRAAIRLHNTIQFKYRRPGDIDALERHVEPWGLLYRNGGWYCVGYDIDRSAPRVFRTSRIASTVGMGEVAVHDVDPDWPSLVASEPETQMVEATLLVAPDHGTSWRSYGSVLDRRVVDGAEYDVVSAHLPDRDGLIGALAAASPHVLVLTPLDLRNRVIEALEAVLHG